MRQQLAQRRLPGFATLPGVKHKGSIIAELGQRLTAGTAGHGGRFVQIRHRYGTQPDRRAILDHGTRDSALFGTTGQSVGAVFDVAARHNCAICKQQRRSNAKAAVRGIRVRGRFGGERTQSLALLACHAGLAFYTGHLRR